MSKHDLLSIGFFLSGILDGLYCVYCFKKGDMNGVKRNFCFLIFTLVILILMCFGWTPP